MTKPTIDAGELLGAFEDYTAALKALLNPQEES